MTRRLRSGGRGVEGKEGRVMKGGVARRCFLVADFGLGSGCLLSPARARAFKEIRAGAGVVLA